VPSWLSVAPVLAQFHSNEALAQAAFKRFVWEGINSATVWQHLLRQQYLGDREFVARIEAQTKDHAKSEVPKQARPVRELEWYVQQHVTRNAAMAAAHASGGYTFAQLADFFGLHYATVSRLVKAEQANLATTNEQAS
jgi:putative transposase